MSWAAFFKSMDITSTLELNRNTLIEFVGITFVVMNLYAAQFAVAH
jgi:hypothetical protein